MQKYVYLFLVIMVTLIIILYNYKPNAQVINFFPLDKNNFFTLASTKLALTNERALIWEVQSESYQEAYLRQDISLLYENGRLKGILSNWKQLTSCIEQDKLITINQPSYLQAISFHHGELHIHKNSITSIQQMTDDYLFVDEQTAFKLPSSAIQYTFIQFLSEQIKEQMNTLTSELLTHFKIIPDDYHIIPLTELAKYEQKNLLHFTQDETDRIMGQLWEGLYKNYLLPALEINSTDYMPIILFSKDHSHLLVIFELNKERYKLKQLLR